MSRKVFDKLTSTAGLVLVVVLAVAGGLLMWGYSFANSNVHSQLSMQQIYFPPKAAFADAKPGTEITPNMIPTVSQYAGEQLLTGRQAEVYANHFIAQHLYDMPYHGVYSKISTAAMANPKDAELAALKQVSFMGTVLRGMLLTAYAFSMIATILFWGAIAAWVGAVLLTALVALGYRHASKTRGETRLFAATGAQDRPEISIS